MPVSEFDEIEHKIKMLTMRERIAKEDYEIYSEKIFKEINELRIELHNMK